MGGNCRNERAVGFALSFAFRSPGGTAKEKPSKFHKILWFFLNLLRNFYFEFLQSGISTLYWSKALRNCIVC